MRPGRLNPGNVLVVWDLSSQKEASMRPGRLNPGNVFICLGFLSLSPRFNEARAVKPWKPPWGVLT